MTTPVDATAPAAPEAQAPDDAAATAPETPAAPVLQDWAPLTQCLDWQVGQLGFQHRGAQAFTTQEVPNLINQGGLSAYRGAEVLFAHCAELEAEGALEPQIHAMEMAIGLGLHAVQLLDRFQQLCAEHGRDWYDRLTFYATDGTPRMLADARDNGVFERHAGHVVLGLVNALDPANLVRVDTGETVDLTGKLRAVFHTYLLCVLPANIFRRVRKPVESGESGEIAETWSVVMARTVLRRADALPVFTALSVDQLQQLAASDDPGDKLPLAPLYPLLDLDLALASLDPDQLSEGPELRRVADAIAADLQARRTEAGGASEAGEAAASEEVWILHSSGAQHSLEQTLGVLRKDGFVLYRDYGPATAERANGNHLYQHYGSTTAAGINHFAIDSWLAAPGPDGRPRAQVTAPPGEAEAPIKNRFVSRAELPASRTAFARQFEPKAFEELEQAVARAREAAGRQGDPMDAYRRALQLERDNWMLLGEAGEIALRRSRQLELAHMLLTEALRINPWYHAPTWNNLGDLYWTVGEYDRARDAYERGVRANPEYFRSYLNLADVHRRLGDYGKAVELAAMAIARDVDASEATRAKAALDDCITRLGNQRELAARFRRERMAGTPR